MEWYLTWESQVDYCWNEKQQQSYISISNQVRKKWLELECLVTYY